MFEEYFFRNRQVSVERLVAYGFREEGAVFVYHRPLLDGELEARIHIDKAGQLTGQVWDLDLGEEYSAFRSLHAKGAFVGRVKEAYGAVLSEIATQCFQEVVTLSRQGQVLVEYLGERFGDGYDFPFEKNPEVFSYRHPANQKWYALFLTLPRKRLDLGDEAWTDLQLEEEVEVVNLKVSPSDVQDLLGQLGVYPAYHMNKKHWVSLVLDEEVSDQQMRSLAEKSRQLAASAGKKTAVASDFWVLPANPKVYDIDKVFAESSRMYWPQKAKIQKGDWLLLYQTAPIQALSYLCRVVEIGVVSSDGEENQMQLALLHRFAATEYPLEVLKSFGLTSVRSARRIPIPLAKEIRSKWVSFDGID